MTPTMAWATRAVVAGMLAAGLPGSAAGEDPQPVPAADAITQCLVQNGYPPLPAGAYLVSAPTPTAAAAALTAPGATPPVTGTPSGDGAANGGAGLQCGEIIINNTVYLVVVTVTTTTTTVDGPITVAAGSITTTNAPAAVTPTTPVAAAPAATPRGVAAIGRALRLRGAARSADRRAVRATATPRADTAPTACPDADRSSADATVAQLAAGVRCLLNERRADQGRAPVSSDRRLGLAASRHAADMVARRYFAHTSLGGTTFADRIARTGYLPRAGRWTAGEILAWASDQQATPRGIVDAWMASPEHRRVLLDPAFSDVGVGVTVGSPQGGRQSAITVDADFGHVG